MKIKQILKKKTEELNNLILHKIHTWKSSGDIKTTTVDNDKLQQKITFGNFRV